MDGSNSLVLWTALLILLIVSGFFSGSETGMMALNRYRLRHQRKKSAGARRAAKLLATPDKLIGLILIGNNAVNILAAIIANMLAIIYVGPAAAPWVATATLTILVLVFSEITPKSIAAQNPEWFAFKASHILRPLLYFLAPLVWIINKLTNGLISLLGFDPNKNRDDGLDTEELKSVVDVSGGKISDNHQRMLKGMLDLENVTIEDIMIPRNEIVGLDLEDPVEQLKPQYLMNKRNYCYFKKNFDGKSLSLPHIDYNEHRIWGFTLKVLVDLLNIGLDAEIHLCFPFKTHNTN